MKEKGTAMGRSERKSISDRRNNKSKALGDSEQRAERVEQGGREGTEVADPGSGQIREEFWPLQRPGVIVSGYWGHRSPQRV